MRIERISENKIKVLIDTEEAREWKVDIKSMSSNTPEIRDMFWTAIKLAERDAEFYVDGAQLFVEAIPGKTDGFGMLITKVFSDNELNAAIDNCSYKGRIKRTRLKGVPAERSIIGKRIFRFSDFENVCNAASAISNSFDGESTLYKLADEYYMLIIPDDRLMMLEIEKVMLEFSQRQERTLISHGRLNELADVMIKNNAVEVLAKYFN